MAGKRLDDPCPVQSQLVITTWAVRESADLVCCDRRVTEDDLAASVDIRHSSIHTIMRERPGYRKVCAHSIPRNPISEQKAQHLPVWQ